MAPPPIERPQISFDSNILKTHLQCIVQELKVLNHTSLHKQNIRIFKAYSAQLYIKYQMPQSNKIRPKKKNEGVNYTLYGYGQRMCWNAHIESSGCKIIRPRDIQKICKYIYIYILCIFNWGFSNHITGTRYIEANSLLFFLFLYLKHFHIKIF